MDVKVTYDGVGTHIDWHHENMISKQVDWFWSNMEKGFILWHPSQHEPLEWAVPPVNGNPIGSIHIAPQTWSDGTRMNLYIRMERLEDLPDFVREYIVYEHVIVVAGIGLGDEALVNPQIMGYRLHQWQDGDGGIDGKSTAIGIKKKENEEDGQIWAKHCIEEIGNWAHFLPALYDMYQVVTNTAINLFADLSVDGKGIDAKYKYMKKS